MSRLVVYRIAVILLFAVLVERLWDLQFAQGQMLANEATAHTRQVVLERPLRGEIYAHDGKTLLAQSLPSYTIAVRKSQLPASPQERRHLFARLDDMLGMTGTLVLSPTDELRYAPGLREGIEGIVGPLPANVLDTPILTATVPISRSVAALMLTQRFTETLQFRSPVEAMVASADLPAYQTIPISTTQSLDVARVVEENAVSLPGVTVELDYRRNYPQSAAVRSLSHLLGYVGPVDQCDIIRNNPRESWASLYPASAQSVCRVKDADLQPDGSDPRYMLNDRIGKDGLEATYEQVLRGQLGRYQVDVDVYQRPVDERRVLRPTEPGQNLVLTVDFDLQKQSESILKKWIAEAERRRQTAPPEKGKPDKRTYSPIQAGVAIVLDVNTGRVRAMVSWPSFDNNIFNRNRTDAEVQPLYHGQYPGHLIKRSPVSFHPGRPGSRFRRRLPWKVA